MKSFATLSLLASVATLATASAHHDSEPLAHKRRGPGWIRKRQIQRRQENIGHAMLLSVANASSYNASSDFAGTSIVSNATSALASNATSASNATVAPTWYKGTALWFIETGSQSACYTHHTDEDVVVGLPLQFWNSTGVVSDYCGQYLEIKNPDNHKTVTALISDASGSNYTTLTKAAFLKLASLSTGMIDIEYSFVNATKSAANSTASTVLVASDDAKSASASAVPTTITSASAGKPTTTTKATTTSKASSSSDDDSVFSKSKAAAYAASVQADEDAASSSSSQAAYFSSKKSAEAASSSQAAYYSSKQAAEAASSSEAAAAAASSSRAAAAEASASREAAAAASASADAKASREAAAAAAASKTAKAEAAAATAKANAQVSVNVGSSSSNSGDDEHTGGYATFYTQNGVAGNCGTVSKDSDYVIALPTAMYANGAHCGKKIRATRVSDGASVVGKVMDSCPTCINNDCLDMSVAMFMSIATEEEGQVAITWDWA